MAVRYSQTQITSLAGKAIFFDANILLYLFWPTGATNWEDTYSSIFGKLLKQQNKMFVDFIVLSEVINRAIRIEYEKYLQISNLNKSTLSFKKYRDSSDGKKALFDIYQTINKTILNRFNVIGKSFIKNDIKSFLHVDSLDFSDKALYSICQDNSYVLLTNDRDFCHVDIPILTANPGLLK